MVDSRMLEREGLRRILALGVCATLTCIGLAAQDDAGTGLRYFHPPLEDGGAGPDDHVAVYDVVVYGGTPAGVAAAVQAARSGKRVALLSFGDFVGGLTSGGLTATDVGNRDSIGGLAAEFYQRVGKLRDFSPGRAEGLFLRMLEEAGCVVEFRCQLGDAAVDDRRITAITLLGGRVITAEMFVDATYEGDLLAAAGVSYRVGREPRGAYDESLAGQWQQVSWQGVYQFCGLPVDPYVEAGDPESGLLPGISSEPAGEPGQGDHRVQAYNFRMFLSDGPDRVPFPKPAGYDPDRYTLLARFLASDPRITWTLNYTTRPMTDGPVQMRRGDSNNAGSFSTDHVGGSHRWPDGTFSAESFDELPEPRRGLRMPMRALYELRERIFQDHVRYQQGLMHFLAEDPRVPDDLQQRVGRYGLDPDEFGASGHWPHALYVREGRRMVSSQVMTQAHCEGREVVGDSVGLASYAMDSHFCQRVVVEREGRTTVRNEGGFGKACAGPYPVSFRAIVPCRSECRNLLVPVCLSASHVAYGSIRMEPVFLILGQSAGVAASMAIDAGGAVQDLDYDTLAEQLLAAGQRL